jgi:hypothetical protein
MDRVGLLQSSHELRRVVLVNRFTFFGPKAINIAVFTQDLTLQRSLLIISDRIPTLAAVNHFFPRNIHNRLAIEARTYYSKEP